ncbi:MAG: hypothetical protein Q4E69_00010 [Bacilli bacterium]|nr:hypothetical protein [Bacilli bacterium]
MIIRKPYAFLIKNFKKIHIFLFALAVYIYFKSTQTYTFVREFIRLTSYDRYNEPITKYITSFGIISLLLLIIGSTSLMLLLKRKEKPWKLYLVPTVQYFLLLIAFVFVRGYFNSYTGVESTAPLRAWRDLLLVSQGAQFVVLIIYIVRILGVDLNKFNFKFDEEYLEIAQSDREELEININIDKESFKRVYRRFLRNLNYVYQEHKFICRIGILIFLIVLGRNTYNYINSHRSFYEGDSFSVNGYNVKINNSYYSDKAFNGDVISKKSAFVIVDATITNDIEKTRTVDLNKYHIINGVSLYTATQKTYETEFKDFGRAYDSVKLGPHKTSTVLLIFKVDKKLPVDRFVLTYQESTATTKNLRKIKLTIKDMSKIISQEPIAMGESLVLPFDDNETITLDDYSIDSTITYSFKNCVTSSCLGTTRNYTAPTGYKILTLFFGTDTYEGKELADFVDKYAKLTYTNAAGKKVTIETKNTLTTGYYGKYVYLRVPEEIEESSSIYLDFIIRNNKYIYKIL